MKTMPTKIDELAYTLYCQKYIKMYVLPSRHFFLINKIHYNEYYIKATNIIRKQKLLKISPTR